LPAPTGDPAGFHAAGADAGAVSRESSWGGATALSIAGPSWAESAAGSSAGRVATAAAGEEPVPEMRAGTAGDAPLSGSGGNELIDVEGGSWLSPSAAGASWPRICPNVAASATLTWRRSGETS